MSLPVGVSAAGLWAPPGLGVRAARKTGRPARRRKLSTGEGCACARGCPVGAPWGQRGPGAQKQAGGRQRAVGPFIITGARSGLSPLEEVSDPWKRHP